MPEVDGGAILLARQSIESDIFYWKPAEWFKIWIYILLNVNHKDTKLFKRGIGYFCWTKEKPYLKGITKHQWHECIRWLKNETQITTQKTTRGVIITVVNYKRYQTLKNYKTNTKNNTPTEAQPKHNRSTTDTINKNGKNGKNERKDTSVKKQKISFNFNKEIWENITNKDKSDWLEAYPSCDIDIELAQMKQWLISNPSKRKTNYRRFITNWLSRSQERGGTKKSYQSEETKEQALREQKQREYRERKERERIQEQKIIDETAVRLRDLSPEERKELEEVAKQVFKDSTGIVKREREKDFVANYVKQSIEARIRGEFSLAEPRAPP